MKAKNKLSPFLINEYFIKKYPINIPNTACAGTAEKDLTTANAIDVV